MTKDLQIGVGFKLNVYWYDNVPEPERGQVYEGEVVGWRDSQIIVRVKDYAVLRFWKRNGLEVCNSDHARRGFRVDVSDLATRAPETAPASSGVPIDLKDLQA